jgi:hypothetical protein
MQYAQRTNKWHWKLQAALAGRYRRHARCTDIAERLKLDTRKFMAPGIAGRKHSPTMA